MDVVKQQEEIKKIVEECREIKSQINKLSEKRGVLKEKYHELREAIFDLNNGECCVDREIGYSIKKHSSRKLDRELMRNDGIDLDKYTIVTEGLAVYLERF